MNVERIAEVVESLPSEQALDTVLAANENARVCLTSSFQAEDMAVLHLLRQRIPQVPVLFLDTGYHFSQTYEYRDRMAKEWSLHLVNVLPKQTVAEQESAFGILYQSDPTRCCQLRKVELHRLPTGKTLWKVSLLADWNWEQVWRYVNANEISHLPQYDEVYLSIGCEPCTALPADPNNPRSGRWGGTKLECGIHTFSKRAEG